MADSSKIEWTDATWNPVTGCTVLSPGCQFCYAQDLAGGRLQHHPSRAGLTKPGPNGRPIWNGKVRFNEGWLNQPLRWRRPRTIFVCAHGDLFHEDVPDEWIDKVFAVMAIAQQHRFQVLTKRAEQMRLYFEAEPWDRINGEAGVLWDWAKIPQLGPPPIPNVWLGVSVEDRARLDRIDHLRATPAAVRFLSLEPLLEDLGEIDLSGIHWAIVGGESGPNARPMHPDWARSIRDQCQAASVPFFFKQWGEWIPAASTVIHYWNPTAYHEWDDATVARVGKKRAGRELDGRTWDEMPA